MGRLTKMSSERDGLKMLVGRLRLERDELRVQRDDFKAAAEMRAVRLFEWEKREDDLDVWAQHQTPRMDWSDRALWASVGAGGVVLVGVLVLVFAGGR